MVGDISNKAVIPFFGIVYIIAVFMAVIQHFSGLDFGVIGIICWIIIIVGAIGFVIYIISCIGNAINGN